MVHLLYVGPFFICWWMPCVDPFPCQSENPELSFLAKM